MMYRKAIFFIFLVGVVFVSNHIVAQTYQFDYMLKATNTRERAKYNYVSYDLVNSADHSCYMEVSKNKNTGLYYSLLFDYERNLNHHFDVLKRKSEIPVKFFHTSVGQPFNEKLYSTDKITIQKLGKFTYKFTGLRNIKLKKNHLQITIVVESHEDDLLIFDFEPLQYAEQAEIISMLKKILQSENETGNFYIKEITYQSSAGLTLHRTFTPVKIMNPVKITLNQ